MEMIMLIFNEKQDKNWEPDRWALHLKVCFGRAGDDAEKRYEEFVRKLHDFDYQTVESETVNKITYEMNHFTTLRGGKFNTETLEKTHEACGVLGDWIINWHKAATVAIKICAIEEEIATRSAEREVELQRAIEDQAAID